MRSGTVQALWRYPVKSLLGETVLRATVGDRGIAGDRAYAIVDAETGMVATAKNPRRWAVLFSMSAVYASEPNGDGLAPATIRLPDGSEHSTADSDIDDVLGGAVGRRVRLSTTPPRDAAGELWWPGLPEHEGVEHEEEGVYRLAGRAPGTFFDSSPVHIVTTASLASFERAVPDATIDARRFRPNLVLDLDAEGFPENDWLGRTLRAGDAEIEITRATSRCVMTTLAQGDLPQDSGVLRAAAIANRIVRDPGGPADVCAGVYGVVRTPGVLAAGDPWTIE